MYLFNTKEYKNIDQVKNERNLVHKRSLLAAASWCRRSRTTAEETLRRAATRKRPLLRRRRRSENLESFLILNNYQITYRSTTNYLRNFIETAKIIKIFHLELYQFLALISFAFLNFKRNEQKTSNWKHQKWNLDLNKYYQNKLLKKTINSEQIYDGFALKL